MKIKTALILCAGFGKRVQPITDSVPKPLINYKDKTLLENTIKFLIKLKINKIKINVFYLKEKIISFIENNNFPINITTLKAISKNEKNEKITSQTTDSKNIYLLLEDF